MKRLLLLAILTAVIAISLAQPLVTLTRELAAGDIPWVSIDLLEMDNTMPLQAGISTSPGGG